MKDLLPRSCSCWQDLFPQGPMSVGLNSLLAVTGSLSQAVFSFATQFSPLGNLKYGSLFYQSNQVKSQLTYVTILHSIITVISHQLDVFCLLEVGPIHTQGQGIIQGCKYWEAGVIEGVLESAHQTLLFQRGGQSIGLFKICVCNQFFKPRRSCQQKIADCVKTLKSQRC